MEAAKKYIRNVVNGCYCRFVVTKYKSGCVMHEYKHPISVVTNVWNKIQNDPTNIACVE